MEWALVQAVDETFDDDARQQRREADLRQNLGIEVSLRIGVLDPLGLHRDAARIDDRLPQLREERAGLPTDPGATARGGMGSILRH